MLIYLFFFRNDIILENEIIFFSRHPNINARVTSSWLEHVVHGLSRMGSLTHHKFILFYRCRCRSFKLVNLPVAIFLLLSNRLSFLVLIVSADESKLAVASSNEASHACHKILIIFIVLLIFLSSRVFLTILIIELITWRSFPGSGK